MTTFKTRKLLFAIAAAFCCGAASNPSPVLATPQRACDHSSQTCTTCHQSGGCVHCPECSESFDPMCQEYCELAISEGKESRTCFEIDYKSICIPKIVPPWRQGCEPLCAETRSVKVLKTKKYECPVCEYKWTVKTPEYQQPSGNNGANQETMPARTAPVSQGAVQAPGNGAALRSISPVIPARTGVPIIPLKSGSAQSIIVPATPVAPPVSGSIGDYFGGR